AFAAKCRAPGLEGEIYREVARIRDTYADEIRTRYPAHWRRVSGYNLDELVKDRPLNMARVVVGSEGTLVTVLEAKVRLVRRPRHRRAAVDLEAPQGRPGPAARDEGRQEADRLRRGHRGRAAAPRRVRVELPRDLRQARHRRRLLRSLLRRLPAHPAGHRPQDAARPRAGARDRRRDHRPGGEVPRDLVERARRRPGAQPIPGKAVRSTVDAGVSRAQARL